MPRILGALVRKDSVFYKTQQDVGDAMTCCGSNLVFLALSLLFVQFYVNLTDIEREQKKRGISLLRIDYFVLRPVRLAAMLPTFRPGGAFLDTVVGRPGDW